MRRLARWVEPRSYPPIATPVIPELPPAGQPVFLRASQTWRPPRHRGSRTLPREHEKHQEILRRREHGILLEESEHPVHFPSQRGRERVHEVLDGVYFDSLWIEDVVEGVEHRVEAPI